MRVLFLRVFLYYLYGQTKRTFFAVLHKNVPVFLLNFKPEFGAFALFACYTKFKLVVVQY